MILACYRCPRQIAFPVTQRTLFARLFGWITKGERFFCSSCGRTSQ